MTPEQKIQQEAERRYPVDIDTIYGRTAFDRNNLTRSRFIQAATFGASLQADEVTDLQQRYDKLKDAFEELVNYAIVFPHKGDWLIKAGLASPDTGK